MRVCDGQAFRQRSSQAPPSDEHTESGIKERFPGNIEADDNADPIMDVCFIDWQIYGKGPVVYELAYMITNSFNDATTLDLDLEWAVIEEYYRHLCACPGFEAEDYPLEVMKHDYNGKCIYCR